MSESFPAEPSTTSQPWYRHKVVTPAALVVLLLVLIGLVSFTQDRPVTPAPTAQRTTDPGQQLLADLAYVGIVPTNPANMIELGHKVCAGFDAGATYWQITASLTAGGYTAEQASKVIAVSAADMCPRYTSAVDAALTPAAVPVQAAATAPAYPLNQITEGTYLVGSEVAPGQYVTEGASICYWEREKNTEGGFQAIIANGNAQGHTTVTIKGGDKAFKVTGSCTFTKR